MTNNIIDISHWEDPVDFKKVSTSGVIAVIAKATQGTAGVDPTYAKFKKASAPYGFLWGSYHFGTGGEADVQVKHYLNTAQPTKSEFICLDFEPNPGGPSMTLTLAREFVGLIQQATGRLPVLYGGHWLKEALNGKADDLLSKCPLWLAQYGNAAVLPPGWKNYTLWQFTDGNDGPQPHTVPGIGKCDRSLFDGSEAQLKKQWPFT
jgi:lysozyme